jgi:hypothetical protein
VRFEPRRYVVVAHTSWTEPFFQPGTPTAVSEHAADTCFGDLIGLASGTHSGCGQVTSGDFRNSVRLVNYIAGAGVLVENTDGMVITACYAQRLVTARLASSCFHR